jgi:hypothetical protein
MSTRFLMNVMFLQFNLMFLHTRVVFSCFGYQIFQGFTNGTLSKNKSFLSHIHVHIFFYLKWLIIDCKILLICNSLLIYKRVEETNYQDDKQFNVKYLLLLQSRPCYSLNLVATRSTNSHNIIRF